VSDVSAAGTGVSTPVATAAFGAPQATQRAAPGGRPAPHRAHVIWGKRIIACFRTFGSRSWSRSQVGVEVGVEVGAEVGVEVGAEVGVEVGAEVGVEVGVEVEVEVGVEVEVEVGVGADLGAVL